MGYFVSETVIKEIKGRLNILNLVETYVSLKRSGRSYVGLCPFHEEKTPSFHVNDEKEIFHCFGCGAGGDIFGFIMRYKNLTFPEAVRELSERAGIKFEKTYKDKDRQARKDILFKLNKIVSNFYHKSLVESEEGGAARDYLRKRGLTLDLAREFQLGYAPYGWDTLSKFLTSKKVPYRITEEIGLIIRKKDKDGYYDRFRERLMFPIRDVEGNVLGFGGRTLTQEEPKYLNSPESAIYHKSRILYGLDKARDYIRRKGEAIMVEGYMDLLSLYFAGIKNVVATLGTALTRDHVMLIKRYTDRSIVIFDGDEAGEKASLRVLDAFLEEGLSPLVAILPSGDDPASFILKHGRDEFLRIVEGTVLLIDFYIETIQRDFQKRKISRNKAIGMVVDVVSKLKNPIERSHYIRKVGENFGIRENELLSLVGRSEKAGRETRLELQKNPEPQEKLLLRILLKFPKFSSDLKIKNLIAFMPDGDIRKIVEEIVLNGIEDVSSFLSRFSSGSAQEIISESIFSADDIPDETTARKLLRDCIRKLKLRTIEERLSLMRLEIEQAKRNKNDILEQKLISEYRDLIKQEKNIHGEANEE
ncbi:MAG: DNA primase [Candidatus Dadabacteria bacterium]|nr:DNA primase [Candidatus Dadabacteria bacterium]